MKLLRGTDPEWDDVEYVEPGPKRFRGRRTDFCRPGRMRFFSHGRSYPTKALNVGAPMVFQYSLGDRVGPGYVVAIDIPRGLIWKSV